MYHLLLVVLPNMPLFIFGYCSFVLVPIKFENVEINSNVIKFYMDQNKNVIYLQGLKTYSNKKI